MKILEFRNNIIESLFTGSYGSYNDIGRERNTIWYRRVPRFYFQMDYQFLIKCAGVFISSKLYIFQEGKQIGNQ